MIYVYTAVLGGFDNLRPPLIPAAQWTGARFVCFTDNPLQPRCDPWEFRPAPLVTVPAGYGGCFPEISPSRSSRIPKILPHLVLPADCEYSIWHDANFQLARSPEYIVDTLLKDHDWAVHKHPVRDCVYEEAEVLIKEKIGTTALVDADVHHMRVQGHPEHTGLWANGFIVRRHTREVDALSERWWEIFAAGCERDQISFPPALRQYPVRLKTINENVYQSPWVQFYWHAAFVREDNVPFYPERREMVARLERLREVTGVEVDYKVNVPEGK